MDWTQKGPIVLESGKWTRELVNLFRRVRKCWFWLLAAVLCFMVLGVEPASAQEYPVERLVLEYENPRSDLPSLDHFLRQPLRLRRDGSRLGGPNDPGEPVSMALAELPPGSIVVEGGLRFILNEIVAYLNRHGVYSVYVTPDRFQVDPRSGRDRRAEGDTSLRIAVYVAEIQEIQSVGRGDRIREERPIDHPKHSRIVRNSPLGPKAEGKPTDFLQRQVLDEYLRRLNRHPGRRVDATVASAGEPGMVDLHYLVTESRPFTMHGQVSNTGTKSVGEWQYRLGFAHYQLTGNDDVLSLDALTSDFDRSYSVLAGYSIPILYPDFLKLSVSASYSSYSGDEFAQTTVLEFSGNTARVGGELRTSLWALAGWAHDVYAGLRYEEVDVIQRILIGDQEITRTAGETSLLTPYLGMVLERRGRTLTSVVDLRVERLADSIDTAQLDRLGRLEANPDWVLGRWRFEQSFFLEPILFRNSFRDLDNWRTSTLGHEISLRGRGQVVLSGDRIIPQEQFVVGGMYSARGYPESVAAADNGMQITGEYRVHIPRLLKPHSIFARGEAPGQLFGRYNLRPPRPLVFPDWDLILRLFMDYGRTRNVDARPFETNQRLLSFGGGLEAQLLRHFNIRVDVGSVLKSLDRFDTSSGGRAPISGAQRGDTRVHVMGTLTW